MNNYFYRTIGRNLAFLLTIIIPSLFLYFYTKNFEIEFSVFFIFIFLAIIAYLNIYIFKFKSLLSREKLHKQKSWFYYYYVSIFAIPITCLIVYFAANLSQFELDFIFLPLFISYLWLWLGYEFYKRTPELKVFLPRRFGGLSVPYNSDKDMLNFSKSARNVGKGILGIEDYVSVIGLQGGMGFGKTTYSRMIVESIAEKNILYSYISLTEVNETNDFSKLFSERWRDTLLERYPKLNIGDSIGLLRIILREFNDGYKLADLISYLNIPISRTLSKTSDPFIKKGKYVSEKIGEIFLHIPEINESKWIIVIDEIERGTLREIFRVIEVIERFKYEGRHGLPMQLVFILNFSKNELIDYLDKFKNDNELAFQIHNYFFGNPKSFTQIVYLPTANYKHLVDYSLSQINAFLKKYKLKDQFSNLSNYSTNSLFDPAGKDLFPDDLLEFLLSLLAKKSPRIIQRTMNEVDFYYQSFRSSRGLSRKNRIRFIDIVFISFIRIEYPILMNFFIKTNDSLSSKYNDSFIDFYLQKKERSKNSFKDWVEEAAGEKTEVDGDLLRRICGSIAQNYLDLWQERSQEKLPLWVKDSLSDPNNMKDYLDVVAREGTDDLKVWNLYQLIVEKQNKNYLLNATNDLLDLYARFVRSSEGIFEWVNYDIAYEIFKRFKIGKLKIKKHVENSLRESMAYEFVFNIRDFLQKTTNKPQLNKKGVELLFSILESNKISLDIKYLILSAYFVNNRNSSMTDIELNDVFQSIISSKENRKRACRIIDNILGEFNLIYIEEGRDIYTTVENYQYVLYQTWNGDPSSVQLDDLKRVSSKTLHKHSDVIIQWWKQFYFDPKHESFEEMLDETHRARFHHLHRHLEVYISLKNLIEETKKAKKLPKEIIKKSNWWEEKVLLNEKAMSKYKEWQALKETKNTLHYKLIHQPYYLQFKKSAK